MEQCEGAKKIKLREGWKKWFEERHTLAGGLETFHEHEVLDMLLSYAIPMGSNRDLAHRLIEHFGSFVNIFKANKADLLQVKGIGSSAATLIKLISDINRMCLIREAGDRPRLNTTEKQAEHCKNMHYSRTSETLFAVCLSVRKNVIATFLLDEGSLTQTSVTVANFLARVMAVKAHSVLLTHNHPGGDPTPSEKDYSITHRIEKALKAVEINFEDHIIVGADGVWLSLRESGGLCNGR